MDIVVLFHGSVSAFVVVLFTLLLLSLYSNVYYIVITYNIHSPIICRIIMFIYVECIVT